MGGSRKRTRVLLSSSNVPSESNTTRGYGQAGNPVTQRGAGIFGDDKDKAGDDDITESKKECDVTSQEEGGDQTLKIETAYEEDEKHSSESWSALSRRRVKRRKQILRRRAPVTRAKRAPATSPSRKGSGADLASVVSSRESTSNREADGVLELSLPKPKSKHGRHRAVYTLPPSRKLDVYKEKIIDLHH
ncbi:hypothetical protein BP5796_03097 [Coleophoma crateriformis]|uniref:Uncharacterized protein n=1 Tax=Coleophoma crateriformis TaxID=565419 RepID=A0A3D8SM53_9HELO|nr:hypothetical protein BP5796_03097 [Coleophoma crateriformis]